MEYTFQFSVVWNNLGLFVQGVLLTLQIVSVAIALGLILGIIGALGRTSRNQILNAIALAYVEFFRNTPFLIQLFFFYFALPNLGVKMSPWQAAVLALAINFGAYATEIIRSGIEGISAGQVEAGKALGLKPLQIFRHVILIPALANIYPALMSQVVIAVLFSCVVSQISAEELTFVGNYLQSRTFRSFEIYLTISLIYVALVWSIKLIALAQSGMTMVCVTHEVGFAREVADRVVLMADGQIMETATPKVFFQNPQHERSRQFLSQILH